MFTLCRGKTLTLTEFQMPNICQERLRLTNGGVMVVEETVADELQSDGGFAHPSVPQHHDLINARNSRDGSFHPKPKLHSTNSSYLYIQQH